MLQFFNLVVNCTQNFKECLLCFPILNLNFNYLTEISSNTFIKASRHFSLNLCVQFIIVKVARALLLLSVCRPQGGSLRRSLLKVSKL